MADYYLTKEGKLRKKKADYRLVNGKLVANTEDTAALTAQETSQKSTWFQKGALEGGATAGNVTKAALGTVRDVEENATQGAVGIFETGMDAIVGIGGKILSTLMKPVFGDTKFIHDGRVKSAETAVSDYVAEDVVDEEKVAKTILFSDTYRKITGIDPEKDSVLGEKSDALVQSAGQLAATAGLQAVGVPWWLTSGATAYGGELENALNQGATLDEASLSAAITAGAEVLTEKISGGIKFGGKTLDDALTKQLARGISNKTVRTLAKLGVDMAGEGGEEVLSGVMSALGQKMTYASEEEFSELFSSEDAFDSFIGGVVLGGAGSTVQAVRSSKAGKDYVSGLTKNEQAVVGKVYRDLVAQEEKSGKVTRSRKTKIYDQVLSDMDKGRISTDTIEEILGKDALSRYDSLSKEAEEFKTLYETEGGKLSEKQKDRLAELKMKNQANAYEGLLKSERAKISRNVADMVKADRLSESYNEQGRKSQKFEADVSQYDAKQRQTIRNAIDSGILNNTNRTHEFVDLIARISADKGVAFDFADNAKLKEIGFALEGVTVNGFVNENGVTVNISSAKALNSVVGHEITHVLEGTELYDTLAQTITEYAKSKGEYDSRLAQLTKLYEGRNANIEQEVVADLVGDYLFTDTDFVNRLSTEHRNVFEKIFDEIKYLCKVATAGSKEARQLEKVKKTFEEVYRAEGAKNPTGGGGVRYAVQEKTLTADSTEQERYELLKDEEINVAQVDTEKLNQVDLDAYNTRKKSAVSPGLRKLASRLGILNVDLNNSRIAFPFQFSARNLTISLHHQLEYGGTYQDYAKAMSCFNEIVEAAIPIEVHPEKKVGTAKENPDLKNVYVLISAFRDGNNIIPVELEVKEFRERGKSLYMTVMLTKIDLEVVDAGVPSETGDVPHLFSRSTISLQQLFENVNPKDGRFLKYVPDGFLNDEQRQAKQEALRKQEREYANYSLSKQEQADDLFPLPGNTYGKDITLEFPLPPGYTERANAATPQSNATLEFPLPPGYEEQVGADAEQENAFPLPPGVEEAAKTADVLVHEDDRKRTFGDKLRGALEDTKKTANTIMTNFADKGWVFENLAKKTNNRELEAKYNFLHYSESRAQQYIKENLMPLRDEVKKTGKTKEVYEYVYHLHNIDRMNLEQPKPVFGDGVTADVSREKVRQLETENPEFAELGKAIVGYNTQIRNMLVDGGVISQETADKWAKMYPHYVPIRRAGKEGLAVNVPLDTGKTGINAPVKGAKGGNSDIEDLIDTMALRTEQTFKAIAKNNFGLELMRTLGTPSAQEKTTMDTILDSFDSHEDLLQEGKDGKSPTFTVFENGKKITFEITKEMYDAMKPTSENLAKTYKLPNAISNFHRGLLTDKNPAFLITNAIKDAQDVLINSQHAAKTYGNFPEAIKELASCGEWYREYIANGGEQNTYFESDTKTFNEEPKGIQRWVGKISEANNFVERVPRLAEYIASRKQGKSIEVAMLDAARVTTNFSAGGDMTKFLNRNGATFLNASVQGAMQQVRNIREANSQGLKGWAVLAAKAAGIGLSGLLVNHLLWDDDEDYEDLSDYVKQNYYVIAKTGDGQFVRIPKGRTLAVIQEAFMQMENLITGNDEVDIGTFADLVITNLAPNNPIDNNILAPIMQVANNTTWYGEALVPTRLQDVPDAEQYDESIDVFSKWLGEKTDYSPYKINYLLDQYSGALGDVILPYLTPEAEGSLAGATKVLAPFVDKFTTDSVMNNQNVSDFYDMLDQLLVNANSMKATDEDTLMSKYMNAMNSDLSDLYKLKREIQNSALPETEKFAQVRELQKQINALAEGSLDSYDGVSIQGTYATVGDLQFRWYEPGEDSTAEPGWKRLTEEQIAKQEEVTSGLGISPSEYWSSKAEYDYAYENPGKYALSQAVGGYDSYKVYRKELGDITSDKDKNGKAIADSRKAKVVDYINNLDAEYGEKIILYVSEFNSKESRDTYGYEIVDYLNSRSDISYSQMEAILTELGFKVAADGRITW